MKSIYVCYSDYPNKYKAALSEKYKVVVRKTKDLPQEDELVGLVNEYDGFLIGAPIKMTSRILKAIEDKEFLIATCSVGLDHIDNAFFDKKNINIYRCSDANYISVAEHTIMLALAVYKELIPSNISTFNHDGRKGMTGLPREVLNKTMGIIGAGKIGKKVIEYSKVLGMKILCNTAHPDKHADLKNIVEFCSLEDLMKNSDIVSVHTPLSAATENLLDKKKLSLMKKDAVLINTSRIRIVDNEALAELLKNKKIFGAGIDIDGWEYDVIDLFKGIDNVILTPHVAGVTIEADDRMYEEATKGLLSKN